MLRSVACGAVVFLAILGLAGCGGGAARQAPSGNGAPPAVASAPVTSGEAIDEKTLDDHGFSSLWTKQNNEGAFHSAYLLPEGIFAVAQPAAGSSSWRLIRYGLENGLPVWIYDLDDSLKYPPVAYHYLPSPEARRSDELYVLQKDVIRCLDLAYGVELWRVPLPFSVSCAPVVDEKQYYIGSLDRRIYAMIKKKPAQNWQHVTGGEITAPGTIGPNGEIFFTSTDNCVYRLESTGYMPGKSWKVTTGSRILGSPEFFSRWLVAGSADFNIYCILADGTIGWKFPTESPVYKTPVGMSLRPDKPIVFGISKEERRGEEKEILWAIDARTGDGLWRRNHVERVLTIGRRAVYVLPTEADGGGRRILALDALKGDELTSLPVEGFDIIPTNHADHGANAKARGVIYLISKSGFMQAIREKP